MDGKNTYGVKYEVKCEHCGASIRIKDLVKLKDRYCCPFCFSTIKINKKEK